MCTGIALCLCYRHVAGVLLLSGWANHWHVTVLDYVDQFVMAYGGLRGVMTFALVVQLDANVCSQRDLLITTTIAVIFVTNFLLVISTASVVTVVIIMVRMQG